MTSPLFSQTRMGCSTSCGAPPTSRPRAAGLTQATITEALASSSPGRHDVLTRTAYGRTRAASPDTAISSDQGGPATAWWSAGRAADPLGGLWAPSQRAARGERQLDDRRRRHSVTAITSHAFAFGETGSSRRQRTRKAGSAAAHGGSRASRRRRIADAGTASTRSPPRPRSRTTNRIGTISTGGSSSILPGAVRIAEHDPARIRADAVSSAIAVVACEAGGESTASRVAFGTSLSGVG